jgi:hypothetical protein
MKNSVFFVALAVFATATSAHAMTWCHDYTYFRASAFALGKGKDKNNLSPVALKSRLQALGYRRIAALKPGESAPLKKGDVVLIGSADDGQDEDHSGFVTDDAGHIDHLIQKLGESGKPYTVEELEKAYDPAFESLLVRRGWTISELRERKRKVNGVESDSIYKNKTFQIYRRVLDQKSLVGVWTATVTKTTRVPLTAAKDAAGMPRCTVLEADPDKGLIRYSYPSQPSGNPIEVTINFLPLPKVILEGEVLAFSAKLSTLSSTDDLLEDEFQLLVTGNGKKPKTRKGTVFFDTEDLRFRTSLKDPLKVNFSVQTPQGNFVKDAPPREGMMSFAWPAYDPDAFLTQRTINVSVHKLEGLQYIYIRRELPLGEAARLKYPD